MSFFKRVGQHLQQQQAGHQQYPQDDHESQHRKSSNSHHPLAALCNPEMDTIILKLVDAAKKEDHLRSPSGKTIYTVDYSDGGVIRRSGDLVGKFKPHFWLSDKIDFETPWCGKWDYDPENDGWASDTGLLDDHEFRWITTDTDRSHDRFTLKCVDINDAQRRDVCKFVMDNETSGTLYIPLKIIASQVQLDELVLVSVATMDRFRDTSESGNNSNRRRDMSIHESSHKSDHGSSSGHKKKSLGKLFGKAKGHGGGHGHGHGGHEEAHEGGEEEAEEEEEEEESSSSSEEEEEEEEDDDE